MSALPVANPSSSLCLMLIRLFFFAGPMLRSPILPPQPQFLYFPWEAGTANQPQPQTNPFLGPTFLFPENDCKSQSAPTSLLLSHTHYNIVLSSHHCFCTECERRLSWVIQYMDTLINAHSRLLQWLTSSQDTLLAASVAFRSLR